MNGTDWPLIFAVRLPLLGKLSYQARQEPIGTIASDMTTQVKIRPGRHRDARPPRMGEGEAHRRQDRLGAARRPRDRRAQDRVAGLAARRRGRARRRGQGDRAGVVRRHRARPPCPEAAEGRARAGAEPGGRRRRPDRAGPRLPGLARARAASSRRRSSLTLGDTEERRRYLNARQTIETLLALKARARRQRERHRGHHRDPLRRQRPPVGPRRLHDARRLPGAAVRHRRPLHRAARQRARDAQASRRRHRDHARDRGDGRRRRHRAVEAAA